MEESDKHTPTVEVTVTAAVGVPGNSALACEPAFSEDEGSDGADSSPPLSELDEA